MSRMSRMASIYFDGRLAGRLEETGEGFVFTYDPAWLAGGTPIAFQYPLRETPFRSDQLPGFFDNLISEGWLRERQSQAQKIDENDHFGLLLANGRDLVGAVTVLPEQEQ